MRLLHTIQVLADMGDAKAKRAMYRAIDMGPTFTGFRLRSNGVISAE